MPAKKRAKKRTQQPVEHESVVEREPVREPEPAVPEPAVPEPAAGPSTAAAEVEHETSATTKREKKTTTFSEEQKEEIIDFLIGNQVIYSKRLAGFKNVQLKERLWASQAQKMGTSVADLKIWYTSMRTMLGRLKKRAKKSGEGGEVVTDMSTTEQWVWTKFAFLRPHIETVEPRNVASFTVARNV